MLRERQTLAVQQGRSFTRVLYVPQALSYCVSFTLPFLANCEGIHKDKPNDRAASIGRAKKKFSKKLAEWRKKQKEKRGNDWQPKRAEKEEAAGKEAEQATRRRSLASECGEREIGQKLYAKFERFERRILEEVFSRPRVS